MVDFSAAIRRKYDILQQQADSDSVRADASMVSARAGAGLAASGAAENFAKVRALDEVSGSMKGSPPVSSGPLVDIGAGSAIEKATKPGTLFSQADEDRMGRGRLGLAKGIAKVPGKGSPKVDKVPAMLAPGEAVLNAPAAKMMGRGLIKKANAAGRKKMGMA